MKDYKTTNYERGYKSAPEVVVIAILGAYAVSELSWLEISRFFGF